MRELLLIFIYLISALSAVLIIKTVKHDLSRRFFWTIWLFSLMGAFGGGVFGTKLMLYFNLRLGLLGDIISAILGTWFLLGIFWFLRGIPEQW